MYVVADCYCLAHNCCSFSPSLSSSHPLQAYASAVYNHRIREATIRYAMMPHLKKTSGSPFSEVIQEHFGRRSLALRAQCEKWCKQLRRHNRAGKKTQHMYVQVFAGGVKTSVPRTMETATTMLYDQVNALVAERSATKKQEREASLSSSSSSSSVTDAEPIDLS